MSLATRRHAWTAAQVAVLVVFTLARWFYWDLGVRFDASPAYHFIQYLDPWFVAHDFFRSILYLHHQAPLQIFVVQGCIKLLGLPRATVVLECLYRALGLALSLALVRALRDLGGHPVVTTVAVSLYVASPTFVLYENWLFYALPTAALIVFSLVALLRFERLGTFHAALLFFTLLGTLALLRATYGALFIGAAAGIVLLRPPRLRSGSGRWTILKAAALPLLVVTLNSAKTSWLVGHPYGSALLWANLPLKVFVQLPVAERNRLIDDGLVSGAADYRGVATDVDRYGPFKIAHAPTGVPLLDLDHLPGGADNSHALEHVLVAEKFYRADAIYLLTHYPGTYLQSVWIAVSRQYVSSAARADGLEDGPDFKRVAPVSAAVERCLGGEDEQHRLLVLVFAFPMALLYGLYRLCAVRGVAESQRASSAAIAFSLFGIFYAGAITLLVSYGDFARYRFEIDPLYLVLAVLGLSDAWSLAARFVGRSIVRFVRSRANRTAREAPAVGPGLHA